MKVVKNTVRKYYKWGEPNATIVGSPTIEKGVVSGFSLSNYLELPQQFKPDSNTWEIVFKFIDIGNDGWIFSSGYFGEDNYVTNVNINFPTGESKVRGCFGFGYGNNYYGLTAPISTTGVQYIKMSWNGSQYAIYVSNTSTFSDTPTSYWNSSTAVSQSPIHTKTRIGMLHQGAAGYTGKIDLTESYIKIGGNLWWQGCSIEEADETDYDWYEDVEVKEVVANYSWQDWMQPVLTNNGTVGGDNYACVASSFESSGYGTYLPYYAFDSNSETSWGPSSGSKPQWLTFYSPTPLKVSNVSLEVPSGGECISSGEIQGSNDNSSWATLASFSGNTSSTLNLAVTDNTPYQYIRLYVTAAVGSSSWGKVKEFKITAQYLAQTFYAVRNY